MYGVINNNNKNIKYILNYNPAVIKEWITSNNSNINSK
jgi:hypothetical protein